MKRTIKGRVRSVFVLFLPDCIEVSCVLEGWWGGGVIMPLKKDAYWNIHPVEIGSTLSFDFEDHSPTQKESAA